MRLNPNNPNNLSRCDDLFILAWAFLLLVPFRWGQTTQRGASSDSLGSLQNYDGDGKENVKKTIGLMSKTTTLHVHHAFLHICPCTTTTWNHHTFSLLECGDDKTITSTISVWTRARPPLFSSNINSPPSPGLKGRGVSFLAKFSRTSPLSDRKVPETSLEALNPF